MKKTKNNNGKRETRKWKKTTQTEEKGGVLKKEVSIQFDHGGGGD